MKPEEVVREFSNSNKRVEELGKLSNTELAKLLFSNVWVHETLFTERADIIEAAIERLDKNEQR